LVIIPPGDNLNLKISSIFIKGSFFVGGDLLEKISLSLTSFLLNAVTSIPYTLVSYIIGITEDLCDFLDRIIHSGHSSAYHLVNALFQDQLNHFVHISSDYWSESTSGGGGGTGQLYMY